MLEGNSTAGNLPDRVSPGVNGDGTCASGDTWLTHPRSLNDLRRFLHSYRIRNAGNLPRTARATIIYDGIKAGAGPQLRRAATELAELDPALAWLPTWKPRVRMSADTKGDAQ